MSVSNKKDDEERIAGYKKKFGSVIILSLKRSDEQFELVFRRPSPVDMDRYMDELSQGRASAAMTNLALSCVVEPSVEQFSELIEKYPAVVVTIVNRVLSAVGGDFEVTVKNA